MNKTNTFKFVVFFLITSLSVLTHADICDYGIDASTDKQWIVSNLCHSDNTAIVRIGEGHLIGRYNPMTYFRNKGSYIYDIEFIETIKGVKPENINCLLQYTENVRSSKPNFSGIRLLSFDNDQVNCLALDLGVYPTATVQNVIFAKLVAGRLE